MKWLLVSTWLGVLSLAAAAQAQPVRSDLSERDPIELPATPYRMYPADLDAWQGVYDLSNGGTMTLRPIGRHMYARVDNRPLTAMIAAAPNVFVAIDRRLQVTLSEGDFGTVTGEVVMVVSRQPARGVAIGAEPVRLTAKR